MPYLFGIAIIGGAASVLTPCVLPLLPAILAVSGGTGRRRAWGITVGIELSFFLLAILLAGAITSLGLPRNTLRYLAAVLLGSFGLVLLVPKLDTAFTSGVSRITARVPQLRGGSGSGFFAGIAAGLPLGLVWAPCAGPILAGITVAASTSSFSSRTLLTMLGYSLGMLVPLVAVITGGQKLSSRLRRALGGGRRVLAPMGVLLLATAVLIGVGGLDRLNSFIASKINLTSTPTASLERRALTKRTQTSAGAVHLSAGELEADGYPELGRLADLGAAPSIAGISHWFNTTGSLSMDQLRGKVVLVDFWTYSCINCIRTLPHVRAWYDRYKGDGFTVIGVHTPEFEFEKDAGNVGRAIKDFGITYPVALDPDYGTWNNYYNRFWPAHYLIDRDGHIRSAHYGEDEYARTESEIRTLLGLPSTHVSTDEGNIKALTPETYLGSERATHFRGEVGGTSGLRDGTNVYTAPRDSRGAVLLDADAWSYAGEWTVTPKYAVAGRGAKIYLHFRAQKVFLVAGPGGSGHEVAVQASLAPGAMDAVIDRYRLYTVRSGSFADHLISLDISPGAEVYSFTFG